MSTFTTSGPITATSGQVISGLRIQNPNGPCIRVVGASNVVIRDSDIGPCGGEAVLVTGGSSSVTVEHNAIRNSQHGVRVTHSSAVNTLRNTIRDIPAAAGEYRHAIEYSWMDGGTVQGNMMSGTFPNDVMSGYESNNLRFLDNQFDVTVMEPTGAAFTMGDSTSGKPGSNNYVAGNIVRQRGGVPAGVFGSSGNTVLEKNCLTAGIQAYNYSGVFVGVTVRNNVINMGNSFVPDTSSISGWGTNVNSTDCSLLPR
ncbi:MAG: right-handed parallel beta-helix repeat-containing protein [Rubrivivax sp.]|nr:right-handed parallel beta-helix repeat-containing protein [Rubrivivax sp.]